MFRKNRGLVSPAAGLSVGLWWMCSIVNADAANAQTGDAKQTEAWSHSMLFGLAASDKDYPMGELDYFVQRRAWLLGMQAMAGRLEHAAIQGRAREHGLRFRARIPVMGLLTQWRRARFDAIVAPGVRLLRAGGFSASSLTLDLGVQATVSIGEDWALHTGVLFPFAMDVNGERELARFPGVTVSAGASYLLSDRWSARLQAYLSAPEGYDGDGEKSIVEVALSFRYWFTRRRPYRVTPPLSGSI